MPKNPTTGVAEPAAAGQPRGRAAAIAPGGKQWFGHPRGLSTLFFTEMWERFSYYGMRALLILFMTASVADGGLGFDVAKAGAIYALYTSLVYLANVPGGWVADRLLWQRKSVFWGGIVIASGHFSMAVPSLTTFAIGGPFSHGHMWFSPIIPMTGDAVLEATAVFEQVYKDLGNPTGALPGLPIWSFFPRAFVIIYFFPVEHDVAKNRRNREIFRSLVKVAADHGWGEYRTHTAFMDDIASVYSFNNRALWRLHETL